MSDPSQLSPAELVARVRESYSLTWAELGAAMNRSPRMMRKIARGETSGEAYREALTELHETGAVAHAPKRRRNAAGKLVKVRAKAGAKTATVTPRDARRGPSLSKHTRTVTHLPDGNRIVRIGLPKTVGSSARGEGLHAARMAVVNVARGSRHQDKRVHLRATVDVGGGHTRTFDVGSKGGYLAADVVADVRDRNGGDMGAWIASQMGDRYAQDAVKQGQLVGLSLTTFNAVRSKEERKALDEAGVRRWNRRGGRTRWG
ncbi:hypothetical protein [Micrococcus yunnanensis]|uniref:Uncharacterized protein n=1 Tax=Micrococcus yunnanensis TaxID=566027 RepID=A0ABR6D5F1_9MICC|nr:hypothetical protein [Micrococcus yunnanensis]MBA9060624.1 hypothetical protein [Micrococcus yunnanensis]MCV7493549.1 hypothetical protein [Micrococcus luteus]TFE80615.1 hypothetical protein E2F93_08805 [Micrococcus yunnanensis]